MSTDPAKNSKVDSIAAADFPALRSFLRGYFHQDMKDEYGSAAEAAREFCEDASADEWSAVAIEWLRLLDRTKGWPLADLNRALTGPLGSSYALTSDDVPQMTEILSRVTRKSK